CLYENMPTRFGVAEKVERFPPPGPHYRDEAHNLREASMAAAPSAAWSGVVRRALAESLGAHGDAALLAGFLAGDQSSFAALLDRHGPLVLRVARRVLGDHHLAEDVFQATFLVLARKGHTVRKRDSLPCWLHGVAS